MKAVLVIDIDEKYIDSFGTEIQFINQKYNCNWELKSMPEKKEYKPIENGQTHFDWTKAKHEAAGWNACLDAITGEEE